MAAPIRVRSDLSSDQVRAFSRSCRDAGQVRRLLAIATILDGGSRSEAARIAGVTLQIIRDWVLRFFGAICPAEGKAAGIVMPHCNSEAMGMHLEEIAFHVAPGAHAVVLLDQAGWHRSAELIVPPNITLMPLPPRCPELNPVENLWQFMRDNWLSNRIFKSYDDIVDHCCFAWNKLVEQPWRIMSIGLRQWAHWS